MEEDMLFTKFNYKLEDIIIGIYVRQNETPLVSTDELISMFELETNC